MLQKKTLQNIIMPECYWTSVTWLNELALNQFSNLLMISKLLTTNNSPLSKPRNGFDLSSMCNILNFCDWMIRLTWFERTDIETQFLIHFGCFTEQFFFVLMKTHESVFNALRNLKMFLEQQATEQDSLFAHTNKVFNVF